MDRDSAPPVPVLRPNWLGVLPGILLITGCVLVPLREAAALGVGRPVSQSVLGQPLNLLFPIRLARGESLPLDCVHVEVVAGDIRLPPTALRVQVEGESESTVRGVRLRSSVQMGEPIVDVRLSFNCPAKLERQYTAFIDPAPDVQVVSSEFAPDAVAPRQYSDAMRAALATANAKPSALLSPEEQAQFERHSAVVAPVGRAQAASAPLAPATRAAAPAPANRSAARRARSAPVPAASRTATAPSHAASSAMPGRTASQVAAATRREVSEPVSRLRLDPAELPESTATSAGVAASAASAAAAPRPPELSEAMGRLARLEQDLARIRQEGRDQEARLLTLRRQLDEARSERYSNPLVLALGFIVIVLGCVAVYLWRSRQNERVLQESAWWNEVRHEQRENRFERSTPAPAGASPGAATISPTPPLSTPASLPTAIGPITTSGFLDGVPAPTLPLDLDALAGDLGDHEEQTMSLPRLAPTADVGTGAEPDARALHFELESAAMPIGNGQHVIVEELIDLEQQVDFFQVLGQDEAAIELLNARVDAGAASPLPYLKLMEILQRHGDEAGFTSLAERFARRFEAVPPAWDARLGEGRRLESYPRELQRVQRTWRDSAASMALLQGLLAHGGDDGRGFDLPAYRDLLMLYGVARDLSEREVRGDEIDLFLPLDASARSGGGAGAASMMATMVWQRRGQQAPTSIDVDITLDDPGSAPDAQDSPVSTRGQV